MIGRPTAFTYRGAYNESADSKQISESPKQSAKARIFLLVDLGEIFFRFRVGGRNKINQKALKIFRAFFFSELFFSFFSLISPEKQ